MTVTTAVSHSTPFDRPKAGSFGVPIPGVTAAVVDVEGTEFMPVGEVGELILNGPNIMRGYWKRPEDTKESIIEIDGRMWLRTGDLVRMDEEGYFHFFDRKRDLIKYKGYSVFARHVEEVLYKHPQIKAAGVVGVRDPAVGQMIMAYVVLQSDARGKVSEEEIMEFCRQNLAHYKVPKFIEFRGELPKTDTMSKALRRQSSVVQLGMLTWDARIAPLGQKLDRRLGLNDPAIVAIGSGSALLAQQNEFCGRQIHRPDKDQDKEEPLCPCPRPAPKGNVRECKEDHATQCESVQQQANRLNRSSPATPIKAPRDINAFIGKLPLLSA